MLKEEIPRHTFESDKAPFAIPSGDERELLLLLAIQEAGAVQARSLEEAAIDEAAISTQAEEALVMG